MPAGGFRTFIAGEVLDENDINDYLMQGVLVFGGSAARSSAIATAVEGQVSFLTNSDTIEYFDGSNWIPLETSPSSPTATGGNGTATSGGYSYHVFQANGDFVVTQPGVVDVLLYGAGGGGGDGDNTTSGSGGGGAGGVRQYSNYYVSAGTVAVTVGAGGAGGVSTGNQGTPGGSSTFENAISIGGGGGGANVSDSLGNQTGGDGGCGGGGGRRNNFSGGDALAGFSGNIGGLGASNEGGGGGGGLGAAGGNALSGTGGVGGAGSSTYSAWTTAINSLMSGVTNWQTATSNGTTIAGGGGGGGTNAGGAGGAGGGGNGRASTNNGNAGTANTGGGGGGCENANGGAGGSGLVIVRYLV